MAESFQFKRLPLEEWRDLLRDINFWLDGFLSHSTYNDMKAEVGGHFSHVQWNLGVGPMASFSRAMSSILQDSIIRHNGLFDHVIEVDMNQAAELNFTEMLTIKVAEVLRLLDRQKYNRLKEENDERQYYSYGTDNERVSLLNLLRSIDVSQIYEKLSTKKYLLVIQNLRMPIKPIMLEAFTEGACVPPPVWKGSFWLVSATSRDVYDKTKPDYTCTIESFSRDDILMLTLYSLHQAGKYILEVINDKDEKYWHIVALRCFHYAIMFLIPYYNYSSTHTSDEDQKSSCTQADITSDELIRQWAAEGILPIIKQSDQATAEQVMTRRNHHKYNDDDTYKIGNVILEAFYEYSLLQLPFVSSTKAQDATKTAAHFLIYNGLIGEHLTIDEFYDDGCPGLEGVQWISHIRDTGWHVSRYWLNHKAKGPTTLILRHCSQQSTLFANLDHLLPKLPFICVLDLSYTPIVSLPSSIFYLQNLQLLSLRGCSNLSNPFSSSNNERIIVPGKNSKALMKLLYLDFSYSNVRTFDNDFFHNMPNLEELILVKCSNLVQLPHSIIALSSLRTLKLTRTMIKPFSEDMIGQMEKLLSLNLIDNQNFLLLPGLISEARDLTNVHIEGWDSIMEEEVKLEGYPSLRSFSLIGSRHIKQLSLYGCRKLEYVDLKELDALEELNISATAIKELPVDIPNLPQLRRLLLMGVPSLRRFPWHNLQRLPDAFYLDQCSYGNDDNYSNKPLHDVQVCISDSRFFYSFNSDTVNLVRSGKILQSFSVRVTSCMARQGKMHDEDGTVLNKKLQVSAYADVNHRYLTEGISMVSMDDVPPFQEAERHVEISEVERYPHGLKYLLNVTKSFAMTDDNHISVSLNDDLSDFDELEECMLRRCHQMEYVFWTSSLPQALRNACVSHLKCLKYFRRWVGGFANFIALKHLRLEHCPRLEGVMPRETTLPSLVTLDILFCYNLKAIFYYSISIGWRERFELPCLRRVHLQELPLLEHILDGNDNILTAPAWEKLHVRGCWSLRRLPRLRQQPGKKAVEVSGERAWWAKLQWNRAGDGDGSILHRGGYKPVLPPASASLRERVIIKSYLR